MSTLGHTRVGRPGPQTRLQRRDVAVGDRVDVSASFQQLAKIDYLDGLGIGLGPREISLVYMAKRFWRVNVSHARTVPLPESGRERLAACEQALREFLSETDISPNQVVCVCPDTWPGSAA